MYKSNIFYITLIVVIVVIVVTVETLETLVTVVAVVTVVTENKISETKNFRCKKDNNKKCDDKNYC